VWPKSLDAEQLEMQKVTAKVHAKGGIFFAQLMHAGRVSHVSLMPEGQPIVAPSAVQMGGLIHTAQGKVRNPMLLARITNSLLDRSIRCSPVPH
jgi:2,4-dienoyl-CoA reductase-like NADH-dependent reductase (Old Yellow Enzyme family)